MLTASAMKSIFLAALLGAVILFIWSTISWMVLPWHQGEVNLYNTASAQAVTQQGRVTSIQVDIGGNKSLIKAKVIRSKPNASSMTMRLVGQFIVQYIAAWLVAVMLFTTRMKRYGCRVGFVVLFGLAAGVICYFPHWIWFRIPAYYTFVNLFDLVIGWLLAGLGLAWLVKKAE